MVQFEPFEIGSPHRDHPLSPSEASMPLLHRGKHGSNEQNDSSESSLGQGSEGGRRDDGGSAVDIVVQLPDAMSSLQQRLHRYRQSDQQLSLYMKKTLPPLTLLFAIIVFIGLVTESSPEPSQNAAAAAADADSNGAHLPSPNSSSSTAFASPSGSPSFSPPAGQRDLCSAAIKGLKGVYELNPKKWEQFEGAEEYVAREEACGGRKGGGRGRGMRGMRGVGMGGGGGGSMWEEGLVPVDASRSRALREQDMLRIVRKHNILSTHSTPIYGDIYPHGLYFIAVGIGYPPRTFFLDIDTGSDLLWLQCDAPCVNCAKAPHPPFSPTHSSLVPCSSSLCSWAQQGEVRGCGGGGEKGGNEEGSSSGSGKGGEQQCDYDIHYGDGSSSMGVLLADRLHFLHPSGELRTATVAFGCGYDQDGSIASPSLTDGILGLGPSPLSLTAQLSKTGLIENIFGHCLSSGKKSGGFFFFGREELPDKMTWTSLKRGKDFRHYNVHLTAVSYRSSRLAVQSEFSEVNARGGPGGEGGQKVEGASKGVMFDSGSSFSYFATDIHQKLLSEIAADAVSARLALDSSDTILPHCWGGGQKFKSVSDVSRFFAPIVLHFGNGALFSPSLLTIQPDDYFLLSESGNICLTILDSSSILSHHNQTTIIGDVSMRGYLMAYDNENHRIGWSPSTCEIKS